MYTFIIATVITMENADEVPSRNVNDSSASTYTTPFCVSQKGTRLFNLGNYLFVLNKTYIPKNGRNAVLYWYCERRLDQDVHCPVKVSTDKDGNIVNGPRGVHTHSVSDVRVSALTVRHAILEESLRRPEAGPASLLNEFITPDVALGLSSETALKQAIQRRRRVLRPKDPQTADGIVVTGVWAENLEGEPWFLGEVKLGEERAYAFATQVNLRRLNVSLLII